MNGLILDTSAIIAVYLGEPTAAWINEQLTGADRLLMSVVNLAECLIVLRQRKPAQVDALEQQLLASSIEFIPPDAAQATMATRARFTYPLNLGDCFAYALAKTQSLPLLTLDRDFRAADIQLMLPPIVRRTED